MKFFFLLIITLLTFEINSQSKEFIDLSDGFLVRYLGTFPIYTIDSDDSICSSEIKQNGVLLANGKCNLNKKVGVWQSYYENQIIRSKGTIKNDFMIGKWSFFYENGNMKAKGKFKKGHYEIGCVGSNNYIEASIKNGKWQYWYANGNPMINCNFKISESQEEVIHGEYIEYYSNGKLKTKGNYHNGSKNGIWTYFYDNGQKEREEYYKYKMFFDIEDLISYEYPVGNWSYWNRSGTLVKTDTYVDGMKASK